MALPAREEPFIADQGSQADADSALTWPWRLANLSLRSRGTAGMYFKSLPVLRGWAALAVVVYHVGYLVDAVGKKTKNRFRHFYAPCSHLAGVFFFPPPF